MQLAEGPSAPRRCPEALRRQWQVTSLATGWRFPGDWAVPAVEAVCAAVASGHDPAPAVSVLGWARAESGAGLDETLSDLAALQAAVQEQDVPDADDVPTRLVRAAALGWAEAICGQVATAAVVDAATGLATTGYLRARLAELYQATHHRVGEQYVLVLVAPRLSRTHGCPRLVPMLLAAEGMRSVFDSGETLALAGPSVAVALCRRDARVRWRTRRLRRLVADLLASDPAAARAGPARVWLRRLPTSYAAACDLLAGLASGAK